MQEKLPLYSGHHWAMIVLCRGVALSQRLICTKMGLDKVAFKEGVSVIVGSPGSPWHEEYAHGET